jgi:hypothetical protein
VSRARAATKWIYNPGTGVVIGDAVWVTPSTRTRVNGVAVKSTGGLALVGTTCSLTRAEAGGYSALTPKLT